MPDNDISVAVKYLADCYDSLVALLKYLQSRFPGAVRTVTVLFINVVTFVEASTY